MTIRIGWVLMLLCGYVALAIDTGVLNVFTDLPAATIKVDGLVVGKESITKLPLQVGEHYVQVLHQNQLVYAKTIDIKINRSTTVVSEHFVDVITNTPSRGAIDREASRIRASRGNLAFGYNFMSGLQNAISIKWWSVDRMGVQGLFGGKMNGTPHRGLIGGRFFVSPADKIYADDVLTGAVFIGAGQYSNLGANDTVNDRSYLEFGINIEAYIGQLVQNFMAIRYHSGMATRVTHEVKEEVDEDGKKTTTESTDIGYMDTLRDLMLVVFTSIGHTNFEVSLVQFSGERFETNYTGGVHFYF